MTNSIQDIPTMSFVGDRWQAGSGSFDVLNKYTQDVVATIDGADEALAEKAISHAHSAFEQGFPAAYQRSQILLKVRDQVEARTNQFIETMCAEAGFPKRDAVNEIMRALETLTLCAEEAKRLGGESIPFAGAPGGQSRIGFTVQVPLGVVVAITPFNAPLNTVCHKVGPAFAAGNAVVLKPSDKTPLTSNLLAMCFIEAGAPVGSITVLNGGIPVAQALLADKRVAFYAFTGSTVAGESIQAAAGVRRTQMELGSISTSIVLADADIDSAVSKCAGSSFRKAGQVCTSIQVLLIQRSIKKDFTEKFVAVASKLKSGDPSLDSTDVGPMISVESARRVESMLKDQPVLLGGKREGAVISPTVIDEPDTSSVLLNEEIFGPVICLVSIDTIEDAVSWINKGPYGLAAGLFTSDINVALTAAMQIQVGGVHINETCSSRVDLMPYGGIKASGFGLEGPHYAVREMSHEKLISISGIKTGLE